MKRIQFVLCLAGLALMVAVFFAFADPPYSMTVGTNSVKLVATRGIPAATAFATNTAYAQGKYIESSGKVYMAVNAGTSGVTAPVHVYGEASDGAITWRRCLESKRRGLVIGQNTASVNTYLAQGALAAVLSKGIGPLTSKGSSYSPPAVGDEPYQGEIYAISDGTNTVLTIGEW